MTSKVFFPKIRKPVDLNIAHSCAISVENIYVDWISSAELFTTNHKLRPPDVQVLSELYVKAGFYRLRSGPAPDSDIPGPSRAAPRIDPNPDEQPSVLALVNRIARRGRFSHMTSLEQWMAPSMARFRAVRILLPSAISVTSSAGERALMTAN